MNDRGFFDESAAVVGVEERLADGVLLSRIAVREVWGVTELGPTGDSGRDTGSSSEARESGDSRGLDCLEGQSVAE